MLVSWWRRLAMRRMVDAARSGRRILRVEGLEDRVTPANIYVATPDPGSASVLTVFDAATRAQKFTITAFAGTVAGGVNVAVGDVDGDGNPDIIAGAGSGGGPAVNVFSGKDGSLLKTFTLGDADSRVGASVAAGDFDGDGLAEVVIGTVRNGQPLVQVVRFADGTVLGGFTPFPGASGVNVAAADVTGDGTPDVVVGAGAGVASQVTVFDGKSNAPLFTLQAFGGNFLGGVNVSAGDVTGDAKADIVVAAGLSGGPRVQVFDGATQKVVQNFFAYDSAQRNGARTVAADGNGDGTLDILTADGPGQAAQLKGFDARTLAALSLIPLSGLPAGTGYDTTAPTATISSSASVTTKDSPIPFTATFNEGVNGFSIAGLTATNGTILSFNRVDAKTYNFELTPGAAGAVSVSVAANAATDAAGNANTASTALSRTFDNTAPTAAVTALTTSDTTPTIRGTVNDPTATVSLLVGGQTVAATVTGTSFTATVPVALAAGTYNVQVTATDPVGNSKTSTQTGALVIDTSGPTVLSVTSPTADGSYTTGATVNVAVAFSEPVVVVGTPTLALNSGGTASFVSGSGTTTLTFRYTVAAGQNATDLDYSTTAALTLPAGATIQDAVGNSAILTLPAPGSAQSLGGSKAIIIDTAAPTAAVGSTVAPATPTSPVPFMVTFSEPVTNFTAAGLTVVNGTAGTITPGTDGRTFTFDVTPLAQGAVVVTANANAASDAAGNPSLISTPFTVLYDTTAPAAPVVAGLAPASDTGSSPTDGVTNNPLPTIIGTAEVETTVKVFADSLSGPLLLGTATRINGTNWSFTPATALADGTYTITATATDAAGNVSVMSAGITIVIDTVAPTPTLSTTAADPTSVSPIPFTVTWDQVPAGFDASDLTVTGGTVGDFAQGADPKTFTFTVTPPPAGGTVSASVAASVATDTAGNPNAASNSLSVTYIPAG